MKNYKEQEIALYKKMLNWLQEVKLLNKTNHNLVRVVNTFFGSVPIRNNPNCKTEFLPKLIYETFDKIYDLSKAGDIKLPDNDNATIIEQFRDDLDCDELKELDKKFETNTVNEFQVKSLTTLCVQYKNKLFADAAKQYPRDAINGSEQNKSLLEQNLDLDQDISRYYPKLTEIHNKYRILNKLINTLEAKTDVSARLEKFKANFNSGILEKRRDYDGSDWGKFCSKVIDIISSTFGIWKTRGQLFKEEVKGLRVVDMQPSNKGPGAT